MVFGLLRRLTRIRVTVAYAVIVTCVSTVLLTLGPQVQDRVIRHTSTNLHNLSHGHVGTLLGSAFVIDAGPMYVWLPGLVCLLAVAELLWRSGRLFVAFVVGHVGATLLVAAGLTAAVELGWLSGAAVTRATDVGMSYGAAAVLGSLTAAIPRRWQPAWIGFFLAVAAAVVALGRDFTDVGHAVALILGMLVSTRFGRPAAWTPRRLLLLGVGVAFGYLVLASTSIVIATACGLLGAAIAECGVRARLGRADSYGQCNIRGFRGLRCRVDIRIRELCASGCSTGCVRESRWSGPRGKWACRRRRHRSGGVTLERWN